VQGVLEKLRQNPVPSLAARICELEVELAREGDHYAKAEMDLRESLKGAHAQLCEQGNSFIKEKKKLQAKLKGEFFPLLLSLVPVHCPNTHTSCCHAQRASRRRRTS
jgi:hypothetical protein